MNRLRCALMSAMLIASPLAGQTAPAVMGPVEAVAAAAKAQSGEVAGTFEMVVGSAGASGFQVYLNSAKDYQDPANFTIELDPGPRAKLIERIGGEPQELMPGKHIRVTGTAKRIAIPQRDGTTHYQTRVLVERTDQLQQVN